MSCNIRQTDGSPMRGNFAWVASLPGLPCLQVLITCSMGSKTGGGEDLGTRLVLISANKIYWCCLANVVAFRQWTHSLASQTHFRKEVKGLVNCLYKPCPKGPITLCHIHHCLSSNNSLENSDREPRHISCYCRSCKNILLGKRAHFGTGISRVHYRKTLIKVPLQNNYNPQWHLVWSGKNYLGPLGASCSERRLPN